MLTTVIVDPGRWLALVLGLAWIVGGHAPVTAGAVAGSVSQDAQADELDRADLRGLLEADGRFAELLALFERAGLSATLAETGPLTLVAPSDEAFGSLPAETRAALAAASPDELSQLLRFHVMNGRWTLADLGRRARVPSRQGQELGLRQLDAERYGLDVGLLLEVDRLASNGVLHVVDAVLQPPGLGLIDEALMFGRGQQRYTIDKDHSAVLFRVMHMQVGAQWGWFRSFAGELLVDAEQPERSEILLVVDAGSIDTRNETRDGNLRAADFFDVGQHAGMSFRSTRVAARPDGQLDVDGELSFRGITRPVSCVVVKLGEGRFGPRTYKIGYETELTIRRSDFGMGFGVPGVAGDEVRLVIALEGTRPLD